MPIYIKRTSGFTEPKDVYVKDADEWNKCEQMYVKEDDIWNPIFVSRLDVELTGLVKDFNVWDEIVKIHGARDFKVDAQIILAEGCNMVGTTTDGYAFRDGDLPPKSTIRLFVNEGATITGRGGNGGYGSSSENTGGYGGNVGGNAIYTRTPTTINNSGIIGAGGGGGGGGKGFQKYNAAGNGGGGAGGYHEATTAFEQTPNLGTSNRAISAGIGGLGAGIRGERASSGVASNGTTLEGGAGSVSSEASYGGVYVNSRRGGTGGNLGEVGGRGFGGSSNVTGIAPATGYYGGQAGIAIDGMSNVTLTGEGLILGRTT